jgi:DNA-binding PadR family transcriptional regulator
MSGYEIRQFMEESTANFWSESYGQIYPVLKRMLAEGLVVVDEKVGEAQGHPSKKVYRLTGPGEERLREWLGVPVRPYKNRNELLLKVFFGNRAAPGVTAKQVEVWRKRYADDLERYEEILRRVQADHAGNPAMPYWCITLRYGIAEAKASVAWCDETLVELEDVFRG